MMPKILNFIWFGNKIPKYAFYSMQCFNKVNPSFTINFIHKTIEQIELLDDDILKYSFQLINDTIKEQKNEKLIYFKKYNLFFPAQKRIISILTDIYKREYVNRYGGIYLDVDTFPIKPFDENLLSQKFMVFHADDGKIKYFDNFFFGNSPGEYCKDDCTTKKVLYKLPENFRNLQQKFFNLELHNEKLNIDNYIIHLCDYTWNPDNNRVEKTKFDI